MASYFLSADDPLFAELAQQLLHWHNASGHEDNIKIAVRDFLTRTGLTEPYDIVAEGKPGKLSRKRVDLVLTDALIEVKKSIWSARSSSVPHAPYVEQIDGYIAQSPHVSLGILTDGRHWLLRTYGMLSVPTSLPWMFKLRDADDGLKLYRWLHDNVFTGVHDKPVDLDTIGRELGLHSYVFTMHYAQLARLYRRHRKTETAKVKRELWELLLTVALGEVARAVYDDTNSLNRHGLTGLDDLFVRHTYLGVLIALITQASYGVDIAALAAEDPGDLVVGKAFLDHTGIGGIIESDFFSWIGEVPGGARLISELAARVAGYDWSSVEAGLASALYQDIIPAEERASLGEYYTPSWLAEAMVDEVVNRPLEQRILDPACGSGQFLVAAVHKVRQAAEASGLSDEETLQALLRNVKGIDLHPVAVQLARSEWVLAARSVILAASGDEVVSPPVYLGDSLQLMTAQEALLGTTRIVVRTAGDPRRRELEFPRSLVAQSDKFDSIMMALTEAIHSEWDVELALGKYDLTPDEADVMISTAEKLAALHSEGRDHIWSYFTRNIVRPLAITDQKVDVIVGNPPWLNYNQTSMQLREQLRELSQAYGTWDGGRYATHADVAGLFFTHSMKLYLDAGGEAAMVMPHSALASGHYAKWRTGKWESSDDSTTADLSQRSAWDLERLSPNDFFPVPACVVFGRRVDQGGAQALPTRVLRWTGAPGADDMRQTAASVARKTVFASPYADIARQGATIVPRCLFFVEKSPNTTIIRAGRTVRVNPRRGPYDKEPWRSLDLVKINDRTIEDRYHFDVTLGATIAPYVALKPQKALLPIIDGGLPHDDSAPGGVVNHQMATRFRRRWENMSELWEANRAFHDTKSLCQQLDYMGKLSAQLAWRAGTERGPRLVYSGSGRPTAAILADEDAIVDYTLYWMRCGSPEEACYLCGVINSSVLEDLVVPHMPRGQFGPRHLQKHLWKLPIPLFDPCDDRHQRIAEAAQSAQAGAEDALAAEAAARDVDSLSTVVARRIVRSWLKSSPEGAEADAAVAALLR